MYSQQVLKKRRKGKKEKEKEKEGKKEKIFESNQESFFLFLKENEGWLTLPK